MSLVNVRQNNSQSYYSPVRENLSHLESYYILPNEKLSHLRWLLAPLHEKQS